MSEERARPKWTWLPGAKRYYNNETHRFASFAQVDAWAQETLRVSTSATESLAEMVADQRLNVADWQRAMKDVVKHEHIAKYVAGRGGLESMTQADWGRIGGVLGKQYRYLAGFAQEIADGTLSEAQIRARAAMYVRSSRDSFERAKAAAMGAPELPAYPGDGTTECLCIISGESRVLTPGGWVPIINVRPGDQVLTHMGQWRRVLAAVRKPSQSYHRLVKIRAPTGQWVACTDNHLWYTPQGWQSATDIDSGGFSWYHVHISLLKGVGHDEVLSTVRVPIEQSEQAGQMPGMSIGVSLRGKEGLSGSGMSALRHEPQGKRAMADYAPQDARDDSGGQRETTDHLRGYRGGYHLAKATARRPALGLVLEGRRAPRDLPLPVGVGASQWTDPEGPCDTPQRRGLHQRCVGKPEAYAVGRAQLDTPARGAQRLASSQPPCAVDLRELRQDFLQEAPQGPAQSLLFCGMPPQGTTLYDLVIEGDHSFVIEGLIAHNSNCQCHWQIREYNDRWEAAWIMSPVENCETCLERSVNWAPLVIFKEPAE